MRMRSLSEAEVEALFQNYRKEILETYDMDNLDEVYQDDRHEYTMKAAFLAGYQAGLTNDITEDDE